MTPRVQVRRIADYEGQKLQQIVRRGNTNSVRYRRAVILLASAGGNTVPVIARLVAADEDTVRDVIHRFKRGHPRLLSDDDEAFVIQTATNWDGNVL